jgi:2-methylcitrate dehydratase
VALVKTATAAVVTQFFGGGKKAVVDVLSQVWIDGQSLRTYRHAPNAGPRKSWAAGDATSRGVRLAMMTMQGEIGYPSALTARTWGFYDVSFRGRRFTFPRLYGAYVMENILFKVSFPAEFHAQTAVECAFRLHGEVKDRLADIERIVITTQEPAIRIISKTGPLYNPADRDHCIQYMTAVGLIYGELTADHYGDAVASDPRIDSLRGKMEVVEDKRYSREYLEPDKRSIANAVQVFFRDGTGTEKIEVEYPIGHRRRREEAIPLLIEKFKKNAAASLPPERVEELTGLFLDRGRLEALPVEQFMERMIVSGSGIHRR